MRAQEIMTRPAARVFRGTTIREATDILVRHGFAALPVVDSDEHVIGIFTEADALRAGVAGDAGAPVDRAMTAPVEVVTVDTDIRLVAQHMLKDRLRSVPVVEHGLLAGVIGRRDLLRQLVEHGVDTVS